MGEAARSTGYALTRTNTHWTPHTKICPRRDLLWHLDQHLDPVGAICPTAGGVFLVNDELGLASSFFVLIESRHFVKTKWEYALAFVGAKGKACVANA